MSLHENNIGRLVPAEINGREATPFQGVGAREVSGRRAAPPIRSAKDYPASGD